MINNETENSLHLQIDDSGRYVTGKEPQGHCSWDVSVNIQKCPVRVIIVYESTLIFVYTKGGQVGGWGGGGRQAFVSRHVYIYICV